MFWLQNRLGRWLFNKGCRNALHIFEHGEKTVVCVGMTLGDDQDVNFGHGRVLVAG
jgi:hypothetical protein